MNQHIYFKNISLTSGRPYSLKIRGLSLYPVRYMLWEKEMEFREILDPFLISFNSNGTDFKTNYQFINSEKEIKPTTVIPSTLPSIEGKKYVLSPIREGWIYVFNNNKKIWYEYKVLPDGRLHKCKWEEPVDDIRTPNDVIVDYIELDKRGIFYLAFSEVQWSQKYLSRLENSEEMRKERMQYLDTTKINNGKNNKDVFSPTDVNIVFNTSPFTIATGIEPLNKMDGDLFLFGFNDPLAIADQLSFEIVNYFDEIEAIIQSIQLGVDPVIIKNALKNGKDTFSLQKKEISNQTLALHKMALLLYHICFGSEESSKRLGIHLDRDRIEKILAVKERKEIRNKIVKNRKNLIEFLKSKNYINALQDYHNNNSEKQIIGKTRVTSHLISLSLPVNAKDKLLDLPERNNQKDEDIESLNFLRDVFEEKNEIGKIIAENINVTLANITTINAVVQTWDNIINAFSNLIKEKTQELPILIRRLNSIKIGELYSEPFFEELDLRNFYKRMKPIGKVKVYPLPDEEKIIGFEKIDGRIVEVKQIALSEKVVQSFQPNSNMYWLSDKLVNSPTWSKFVGGMAYLNLAIAIKEGTKIVNDKQHLTNLRNTLALLSAASSVLAIHLEHIKLKHIKLKTLYTVGGYFLDAGISAIDSGINFYEGDWDAGTAYGISGILGAITGIGIILGIFPPLGLVVLFASSLGSGIIAQLLEDSPIERYVKNCILRKGIDTKLLKEPFENVIELVKDREKHTKYGFEKWKDLQEATMNLMDIIFGYSVKTKLEHDWKYEGEENINKGLGERLGKIISESIIGKEAQTKKIESEFKFKMFMEDVSHLEYEIRIYPEGLKNSNYYFILQKSLGKDLEYKRNEKGIVTTTVSVTIPDEIFKKLQGYGDILMLTRLHYNNSLIFPEDDGNIPRFLAIKNTTSQNMGGNSSQNIMEIVNYLNLFGDKIRVGTLNEVLNEKTWIGEKK